MGQNVLGDGDKFCAATTQDGTLESRREQGSPGHGLANPCKEVAISPANNVTAAGCSVERVPGQKSVPLGDAQSTAAH